MEQKVFYSKRTGKDLALAMGGLLMAGGCIGMLAFLARSVVDFWPTGRVGLIGAVLTLVYLLLALLVAGVMLVGVVFFGGCGLWEIKQYFRPKAVLQVLPDGILGKTNVWDIEFIPWECIASVRLETQMGQTVIGIQTTAWPPYPLWKNCSGGVRRMLWQRHNRRQTPFWFYVKDADAPPEVIFRTIEEEWKRARERGGMPRPLEEGGAP